MRNLKAQFQDQCQDNENIFDELINKRETCFLTSSTIKVLLVNNNSHHEVLQICLIYNN